MRHILMSHERDLRILIQWQISSMISMIRNTQHGADRWNLTQKKHLLQHVWLAEEKTECKGIPRSDLKAM